jgi:hypothetical protein
MKMYPIPKSFRDRDIWLSSCKTVDKKDKLSTVSNTSIYCWSDTVDKNVITKVGTVYLV